MDLDGAVGLRHQGGLDGGQALGGVMAAVGVAGARRPARATASSRPAWARATPSSAAATSWVASSMLWGLRCRPRAASARSSRPWAERCAARASAKASAARPGRVMDDAGSGDGLGGANRGGQNIQQPAALAGQLGSRPQRQCGGLSPAQQGGRGGVVLSGLTGALGPEGPRRSRAAGDGHRRPAEPEGGHLAHGRVPQPAVLAPVGARAEAGDHGRIGAEPGPGGDGPQLVDQGPSGPVGFGSGRPGGHGSQLAQAEGTPQAGHLGGIGIDLGGQLLGLLGLEAGGDLGQDGGGRLQPGQLQVLVGAGEQIPAAQDVELGVGAPPAQGHVDAGPHGRLGGQAPAGLVGLALGRVGGQGVAVGQAPDDPGADPMGEVGVVDHHPPPALELDDQGRVGDVLAQSDLDDLAPLPGLDVVLVGGARGPQGAVALGGDHLVAGPEADAGQVQRGTLEGAVGAEQGPGPVVQFPALDVVIGGHGAHRQGGIGQRGAGGRGTSRPPGRR